ncbi:DUF1799 domain-containing protein [Campylobacter sp. 19-13652]|uniref:DUF1799 domain-containing protein n=1 Tax=Campylobacter sp. 19-13652 TaxID=2840180 RepID=UPI001C84C594|nr:DUF1799 domain-containing protein [Campylobacter sp. 19-13652]
MFLGLNLEIPSELLPPYLPKYLKDVLDFYQSVKTQWRVVSGFSGMALVGLDYGAVFNTAKIFKFDLDEFNFLVLQEIERFIINWHNEKMSTKE